MLSKFKTVILLKKKHGNYKVMPILSVQMMKKTYILQIQLFNCERLVTVLSQPLFCNDCALIFLQNYETVISSSIMCENIIQA